MNFYINQSIPINYLRVGSLNNSSVLQIGSAGIIKPLSTLYNTGGFTEAAPEALSPGESPEGASEGALVPLTPPAAS
ncbi:spore germination protein GerPB [Metabacillus herbersteinensis]|uniref:Spore germination protein GerPB n=1 Tax=Metabacillus herbersteinensis TaxID=283816 RepID=A0ABV6GN09_9BACI